MGKQNHEIYNKHGKFEVLFIPTCTNFFGFSLRAIQEKRSFELICIKWQDSFFSSNTLGNGQRKP